MFRASDGYIVFTILQPQDWDWFIARIGRHDKVSDPRWSNADNRFEDRYEIIPIIEKWLQTFPKREEPVRLLLDRHLLAGSVLRLDEAVNHPQIQSRHVLQTVEVPEFGTVLMMKVPWHFSDASVELAGRVAGFGEDNAAVLQKYLGYGKDRIAALQSHQVFADKPAAAQQPEPRPRPTTASDHHAQPRAQPKSLDGIN